MPDLPPISLFGAIEAGMTIICASAELSRHVASRYGQARRADGRRVWLSPNVLSWQAWLRREYDQLLDSGIASRTVLSGAQERLVWEDVISSWDVYGRLLQMTGAAQNAASASRMCHRHGIKTKILARARGPETSVFLEWLGAFNGRVDHQHWCTVASLDVTLAEAIASNQHAINGPLVLTGFDELGPVEGNLIQAIVDSGTEVFAIEEAALAQSVTRYEAQDLDDELDYIVRWCAYQLQQNTNAQIGIATPDPAALRHRLDHRLQQCFGITERARYRFSSGLSLSDVAEVHDALLWLQFAQNPLPQHVVAHLLDSAAFNYAAEERWHRSALEIKLIDSRRAQLDLSDTLTVLAVDGHGSPVIDRWTHALRETRKHGGRATLREWSTRFARWLRVAGWPGDRPDISTVRDQFMDALAELARLSHLHPECDAMTAIGRLQNLSADVPAYAGHDAPIQIISVVEATKMRFDALWVAQMDDEQWPRPATPNTLLPITSQRTAAVPGCTSASALSIAERHTQQLMRSADELVFSHALAEGERRLRVSNLLRPIATVKAPVTLWPQILDPARARLAGGLLEQIPDWNGETIAQGRIVRGGTRLLKDQSDCPFRAYVTHRLGVEKLEPPSLGVDRRDAGKMLHRALEIVWNKLETSTRLASLDPQLLSELINSAVKRTVSEQSKAGGPLKADRYQAIEITRLNALLIEWLEFERQRDAPFTVLSHESGLEVQVGGLSLRIVIDRLDQLGNGNVVVIDYKTGNVSTSPWYAERLGEPQVPLYATNQPGPVDGAFLARVKHSKMQFAGLAKEDGIMPKSRSISLSPDEHEWQMQMDDWRQQLDLLGSEAAAGVATVTPINWPATCKHCGVKSACRISATKNAITS